MSQQMGYLKIRKVNTLIFLIRRETLLMMTYLLNVDIVS